MAQTQSFTTFEQNHLDVVLAVDFNFYGTRMATASADHRVKVYDRKEDTWNLVDTFGAHDAEITDVCADTLSANALHEFLQCCGTWIEKLTLGRSNGMGLTWAKSLAPSPKTVASSSGKKT